MPFLFGAGRRRCLLQKERRGIDMKKFLAALLALALLLGTAACGGKHFR